MESCANQPLIEPGHYNTSPYSTGTYRCWVTYRLNQCCVPLMRRTSGASFAQLSPVRISLPSDRHGGHNVWVGVVNVGVGMVAQRVLVRPHQQRRAVQIVVQRSNSTPHGRTVRGGKVAAQVIQAGRIIVRNLASWSGMRPTSAPQQPTITAHPNAIMVESLYAICNPAIIRDFSLNIRR